MFKKFLVLTAVLSVFAITSCTSKKANKDNEVVAAEGDAATASNGEQLENLDGDTNAAKPADGTQATNTSDQLTEESLGEPAAPNEKVTETAQQTPPADPNAQPAPAEQVQPQAANPPPETLDNAAAAAPTNVTEAPPPETPAAGVTETNNEEKPKKNVPLQKMATAPWKVGSVWFNTVYFARPDDTLKSVSQKIYGNADRVKEMKKGNPSYKSRDLKPGDKVYYNSPNRADDSAKMLTYYEDNGIAPKSYVAKGGDNLRKISKELLGYPEAWKEVWAYNLIESKGDIPEGTEIKYWADGSGAIASNNATPQTPPAEAVPAAPPAPPVAEMPPPPPPMDPVASAPPPPPPSEMAPPPPAPHAAAHEAEHESTGGIGGLDQDMMLALGLGGVALILVVFMFIRNKKKKQQEFEQAMSETQVGT